MLGAAWKHFDVARHATAPEYKRRSFLKALQWAALVLDALARTKVGAKPERTDGIERLRLQNGGEIGAVQIDDLRHCLLTLAEDVRGMRPWYVTRSVVLVGAGLTLLVASTFLAATAYRELSVGGFRVAYFKGTNFEKQVASRTERLAFRDYGETSPSWGMPRDRWSARWTGILHVPDDANYRFDARSDDGIRVTVGQTMVIDYWSDHGWDSGTRGEVRLRKGTYPIRIEHYENAGCAAVRVTWTGGAIPPDTVVGHPFVTKE
jgi:hypothetical protein